MRAILAGLLVLTLAACGADGPPERPPEARDGTEAAKADGITLSGYARIGIVREW